MRRKLANDGKHQITQHISRLRLKEIHRKMNNKDFRLEKYKQLCLALLDSGYTPLTVYSYLEWQKKKNNTLVVLRHEIDRK